MIQRVMDVLGVNRIAARRSNEEPAVARMCVERVHKFSSQYGGENSRGYSALNLAGESCKYPNYGDFSEACVMRTYGPWWRQAPSARANIGFMESWFIAEDFIDLYFPNAVNPERVDIYETFNPGAVVRILACNKAPHQSFICGELVKWEVLWKGPPVKTKPYAICFSPEIKKPSFPTRLIRIELNQSLCDYYTELDAVYLTGTNSHESDALQNAIDKSIDHLNLANLSIKDVSGSSDNSTWHLQNEISITERNCCGSFQILPDEIISYLLSFLSFKEFAALAQCCRFFQFLCYDPVWYKELNLQPFWSKVSDTTLDNLIKRCSQLDKLNCSWIGPLGLVSAPAYTRFLKCCGSKLTHLRLSACEFLNKDVIDIITNMCSDLIELNLSSCDFKDPEELVSLRLLKKLQILNLYRIPVSDVTLVAILKSCKNLEFLNIGSNIALQDGNLILNELSSNCKNLRGLDMWRCRSITAAGVETLCRSCNNVEELDFGWCSNVKSHGSSLICIAENLRNLRKLFLTAVRSVNNKDIDALASYSTELEQFDILGTGNVNSDNIYRLLQRCNKLKLLDVSFCNAIDSQRVHQWRQEFPGVAIKKSFTG